MPGYPGLTDCALAEMKNVFIYSINHLPFSVADSTKEVAEAASKTGAVREVSVTKVEATTTDRAVIETTVMTTLAETTTIETAGVLIISTVRDQKLSLHTKTLGFVSILDVSVFVSVILYSFIKTCRKNFET